MFPPLDMPEEEWRNLMRDCTPFPAYTDYLYGVDTRPQALEELGLHPILAWQLQGHDPLHNSESISEMSSTLPQAHMKLQADPFHTTAAAGLTDLPPEMRYVPTTNQSLHSMPKAKGSTHSPCTQPINVSYSPTPPPAQLTRGGYILPPPQESRSLLGSILQGNVPDLPVYPYSSSTTATVPPILQGHSQAIPLQGSPSHGFLKSKTPSLVDTTLHVGSNLQLPSQNGGGSSSSRGPQTAATPAQVASPLLRHPLLKPDDIFLGRYDWLTKDVRTMLNERIKEYWFHVQASSGGADTIRCANKSLQQLSNIIQTRTRKLQIIDIMPKVWASLAIGQQKGHPEMETKRQQIRNFQNALTREEYLYVQNLLQAMWADQCHEGNPGFALQKERREVVEVDQFRMLKSNQLH